MRLDYTDDDAVAGTASGSGSSSVDNAILLAVVTIGPHVWEHDPAAGSDTVTLTDDKTSSFSAGVEDRVRVFAGGFTGPDLARLSHRFTAAAADLPANTALRSVRVLDVLLEYACAPGLSRALSLPASPRPRFANR